MRDAVLRFLFCVIVIATCLAPVTGAAQSEWTGEPTAADCTIEPQTAKEIADAIGTEDVKEGSLPLVGTEEESLPKGEPATDDQIDAASEALWGAVACLNAGDFGKFLGAFSPNGIRSVLLGVLTALGRAPGPLTAEELATIEANLENGLAETPVPTPAGEGSRIDRFRNVRVLPDDRILVIVDGKLITEGALVAIMVADGDHWLIDEFGQLGETDIFGIAGFTTSPTTEAGAEADATATP